MDWLREHYKQFEEVKIIDEYEQNKIYRLKGNFRIVPYYGDETVMGFECDHAAWNNRTIGLPNLRPFPGRPPEAEIVSDMRDYRVESGYSACANLESWKVFADEMKKGNWAAELPSSCLWLKRGEVVYGPRLARESYEGSDFVQIRLRSGTLAWIEAPQLE
jgi:hypothetical protein